VQLRRSGDAGCLLDSDCACDKLRYAPLDDSLGLEARFALFTTATKTQPAVPVPAPWTHRCHRDGHDVAQR
jgi:hypothetical protein